MCKSVLRIFPTKNTMAVGVFSLLTLADTPLNASICSSSGICVNGMGEGASSSNPPPPAAKNQNNQKGVNSRRQHEVYKHFISWNPSLIPQNQKVTFVGESSWEGRAPGLAPTMSHTPEVTREGPHDTAEKAWLWVWGHLPCG